MPRRDSLRLCLEACSIGGPIEVSYAWWSRDLSLVKLTLLTPLEGALLFSAVGEPRYISFLRLTPGVASSVFLRTF